MTRHRAICPRCAIPIAPRDQDGSLVVGELGVCVACALPIVVAGVTGDGMVVLRSARRDDFEALTDEALGELAYSIGKAVLTRIGGAS